MEICEERDTCSLRLHYIMKYNAGENKKDISAFARRCLAADTNMIFLIVLKMSGLGVIVCCQESNL